MEFAGDIECGEKPEVLTIEYRKDVLCLRFRQSECVGSLE